MDAERYAARLASEVLALLLTKPMLVCFGFSSTSPLRRAACLRGVCSILLSRHEHKSITGQRFVESMLVQWWKKQNETTAVLVLLY
jgi:hypothetical protein